MCGRRPKKIEVRKIEEELTTHYEHKKYCRVRIGDILGKRYHILGKLGCQSRSFQGSSSCICGWGSWGWWVKVWEEVRNGIV